MRKIIKYFLIALLIVPCAWIFAACSTKNTDDNNNFPPPPADDSGGGPQMPAASPDTGAPDNGNPNDTPTVTTHFSPVIYY